MEDSIFGTTRKKMKENTNKIGATDLSRRTFIKSSFLGAGSMLVGGSLIGAENSFLQGEKVSAAPDRIKAFNIDFNWGEGGRMVLPGRDYGRMPTLKNRCNGLKI